MNGVRGPAFGRYANVPVPAWHYSVSRYAGLTGFSYFINHDGFVIWNFCPPLQCIVRESAVVSRQGSRSGSYALLSDQEQIDPGSPGDPYTFTLWLTGPGNAGKKRNNQVVFSGGFIMAPWGGAPEGGLPCGPVPFGITPPGGVPDGRVPFGATPCGGFPAGIPVVLPASCPVMVVGEPGVSDGWGCAGVFWTDGVLLPVTVLVDDCALLSWDACVHPAISNRVTIMIVIASVANVVGLTILYSPGNQLPMIHAY